MATPNEVRQYLAHWFQLGKHLCLRNGQERLLPDPVIQGDRYSDAFEACWQRVMAPDAGDCYLEGTEQTVQQLLAAAWELLPCARCTMPVPVYSRGVTSAPCPCNDLRGWPNLELPLPRSPVSSQDRLRAMCRRIEAANPSPPEASSASAPPGSLEVAVETPASGPIAPDGQAGCLPHKSDMTPVPELIAPDGQAGCLPHKSDMTPASEPIAPDGQAGRLPHKSDMTPVPELTLAVPHPPNSLPALDLTIRQWPREESSARSAASILFGFTVLPPVTQPAPIAEERPELADG